MTTVVANIHNHRPVDDPNAVYIGRPSKWGNPIRMKLESDRADVIALFELYLKSKAGLVDQVKAELRGKTLLCYCHPKACHGDVLARVADE